ncbi:MULTISPECIES: hypothetical protein [Bacillaceae]|uniref:hypothetical protein n=1 Tax=Bacillaceae TaxID=186817 RepID=UPI000E2EE398|nr:hypothetical protein [Bacillus sp. HNG]RFB09323.1 hypothetical protein DZB84_24410 [Bacillus sp. HNG]
MGYLIIFKGVSGQNEKAKDLHKWEMISISVKRIIIPAEKLAAAVIKHLLPGAIIKLNNKLGEIDHGKVRKTK